MLMMDHSEKGRRERKVESIVRKGFLKVTICAELDCEMVGSRRWKKIFAPDNQIKTRPLLDRLVRTNQRSECSRRTWRRWIS